MNNNRHDINRLIELVETRLGRSLRTPSDFDALLLAVSRTTGESLSISTIKRLVGYVSDSHEPSNLTLSVLARYVGYSDWMAFRSRKEDPTSGSLTHEVIQSESLTAGDEIEMEWLPERYCRLRYTGRHRFTVVEARGSKRLAAGDTLDVMVFAVGQPMMATNHNHNGEVRPLYTAGRVNGLTRLTLIKKP